MRLSGGVSGDHGTQGAAIHHDPVVRASGFGIISYPSGEFQNLGQMRFAGSAILPRIGDGQNADTLGRKCREKILLVCGNDAVLTGKENDATHPCSSVASDQHGIAVVIADAQELWCVRMR